MSIGKKHRSFNVLVLDGTGLFYSEGVISLYPGALTAFATLGFVVKPRWGREHSKRQHQANDTMSAAGFDDRIHSFQTLLTAARFGR